MTNTSYLFHDGGRYYIETSPLICYHGTGFYMITAFVMKELNLSAWSGKENAANMSSTYNAYRTQV